MTETTFNESPADITNLDDAAPLKFRELGGCARAPRNTHHLDEQSHPAKGTCPTSVQRVVELDTLPPNVLYQIFVQERPSSVHIMINVIKMT